MVAQLLCDHRYVFMRQFLCVYKLRHIVRISIAKFSSVNSKNVCKKDMHTWLVLVPFGSTSKVLG